MLTSKKIKTNILSSSGISSKTKWTNQPQWSHTASVRKIVTFFKVLNTVNDVTVYVADFLSNGAHNNNNGGLRRVDDRVAFNHTKADSIK